MIKRFIKTAQRSFGVDSTLLCHCERPTGASQSHDCCDEGSPLTPTLSYTSLRIQAHKTRSSSVRFASRRARGRCAAFTLAEVLITLAIIGVVAVMTIPTLIGNYKKRATETKIKKFYSQMTQAIRLSEIDNGPALKWDKAPMAYDEEGNIDNVAQRENARNYWNTYLAPYIKTLGIKDLDDVSEILVSLSDGSDVRLNNGQCVLMVYYPHGYSISANAENGGAFHFQICTPSVAYIYRKRNPNKAFGCYQETLTREEALLQCETTNYKCSCLLEFDNWEFKEDYPYKF